MQIDFSCHEQMHDWGWISAYLKKKGIVEVTNFRLEKFRFSFSADKYGFSLKTVKNKSISFRSVFLANVIY